MSRQVTLLNEIDTAAMHLVTTRLPDGWNYLERSSRTSTQVAKHWIWIMIATRESGDFLGFAVQCRLVGYTDAMLKSMPSSETAREAHRLIRIAREQDFYNIFKNKSNLLSVAKQSSITIGLLENYAGHNSIDVADTASSTRSRSHRSFFTCFCFEE